MSTKVVRQTVTVGEGGRIQLELPELAAGTRAEVTVTTEAPTPTDVEIAAKLAAFDALVESLNLDEAAAATWMREVREMREESSEKRLAEGDRAFAQRGQQPGNDSP